jgi:hypothetical protein
VGSETLTFTNKRSHQCSQAPSYLAFADSAAHTDFRVSHLDRISVEKLGSQGGKHQLAAGGRSPRRTSFGSLAQPLIVAGGPDKLTGFLYKTVRRAVVAR